MSLFKWSTNYSVGATLMDDHHKKLFDIMNKLYEVRSNDSAKGSIVPLLNELIQYTEYHFNEEEILMERAGYPGLGAQRMAHKELVDKLKGYRTRYTSNPDLAIFVIAEAAMTATDWLKSHILKMDKQYEGSLKTAGLT